MFLSQKCSQKCSPSGSDIFSYFHIFQSIGLLPTLRGVAAIANGIGKKTQVQKGMFQVKGINTQPIHHPTTERWPSRPRQAWVSLRKSGESMRILSDEAGSDVLDWGCAEQQGAQHSSKDTFCQESDGSQKRAEVMSNGRFWELQGVGPWREFRTSTQGGFRGQAGGGDKENGSSAFTSWFSCLHIVYLVLGRKLIPFTIPGEKVEFLIPCWPMITVICLFVDLSISGWNFWKLCLLSHHHSSCTQPTWSPSHCICSFLIFHLYTCFSSLEPWRRIIAPDPFCHWC